MKITNKGLGLLVVATCTGLVLLFAVPWTRGATPDGDLMQRKTLHAQAILGLLAKGDLSAVSKEAEQLEQVTRESTRDPQSESYALYGEEFLKIVRELRLTASDKNMAGTYYHFSRMTSMCFSCHEHIRQAKK